MDWKSIVKSKYFKPGLAVALFMIVMLDVAIRNQKEESKADFDTPIQIAEDYEAQNEEPVVFKITPDKIEVAGPLHHYFEVVEREYKIVNDVIKVELRRIAEGLPEPWKQGMEIGYSEGRVEPGFTIDVIDADGDIECSDKTSVVSQRSDLEQLMSLNVDETSTVSFNVYVNAPVKFRIGSAFTVHPEIVEEPKTEATPVSQPGSSKTVETPTSNDNSSSKLYDDSEYSDDSDDSEYSEDSEYSDYSDDSDDDYDPETASRWEKTKHKTKQVYDKSKKAAKKTYKKAKEKLRDWLNEED